MMQNLLKYLLEGLAVVLVAHYLPQRKMAMNEVLMMGLTAATTFWLLDTFAPGVAAGARLGAGFGVGGKLTGWGREGFCGVDHE